MIFLRPWLLCLIILPFLFNRLIKHLHRDNPWKKIIDAKLLPYLMVTNKRSTKGGTWAGGLKLLWILFCVAIAGPCVNNIEIPAVQDLKNTVLIVDLGPTMTPEVLRRTKTALYDLTDILSDNRIALVVYADKGYTASPLTADREVIKNLIPALHPSILPNTRSMPQKGFEQAEKLIDQSGRHGRIIYLTAGGVNVQNIKPKYPVGILNLGSSDDASPALKQLGFFQQYPFLQQQEFANLLAATDPATQAPDFTTSEETTLWLDIGGILCLILLPFFALTFRKGVLFILALSFYSVSAHADFFVRADQKLYQQEQAAVQAYHQGQYDQALSGFAHNPYNQGNTLAYMGQIPEAIQAYKLALQLDPNDADAQFNKEYLEEQLKKQQQEQQQSDQNQDEQQTEQQSQQKQSEQSEQENNNQDENSDTNSDSSKPENQQDQTSDQNQSERQEQQENESASESSTPQQRQNEQTNEARSTEENANEQNQPLPLDTAERESPFNQQEQQILNRLNKDPSQVLRYRIYKQHMQGE